MTKRGGLLEAAQIQNKHANIARARRDLPLSENMKTIRIMVTATGVAILLLSPALTGCKRDPVERTSAEHQDDDKLTEQVKATFNNSPSFKFPDVQVASFKGTVQLSGFVLSDDQKQAAENLAKGVPGVVTVENKISRKP
ncbi:MAG: BON domain-containing protein [Chthoniobacterales bacterium]|nr:BON domain-containing protein [Chthoniobacterales bacterium]